MVKVNGRVGEVPMSRDNIKHVLLKVAQEAASAGPGWAQEGVVLRNVADTLSARGNLATEQTILEAWHDLFADGVLAWGYNLDNPGSPFFHVRRPA